ncbi:MAG: nucleotidyltransferase domain-containing protein [Thermoleophilaceae bacterium]
MIDDAAIVRAGRTLASHAASPARVLLFGSRARGEGRPDSDLDFLVIEERVDSKLDEMVRLRDALAELDVPVDVVVVSREEAERVRMRPGSLVRRALAEGRVLVEP